LHGLNDEVAVQWIDGLRLRLVRLLPADRAGEVLAPDAWRPFLRPNAFETTRLAVPNVTRISEWMAPSDLADLIPGSYRLEISWNGRNLAPDAGLPPDGIVTLPPLLFTVAATDTAPRQALHQRHLAWERFVTGDFMNALASVREADRLEPSATDPLSVQSRLLGATCAARLQDAFGAAQLLDRVRSTGVDDNDHLADFAETAFASLAPQMRWVAAPGGGGQLGQLQITVVPGGTYVVQRSKDLVTWTSVSTNTPSTTGYAVDDTTGTGMQFYRVIWQR
jgi:hypothetical protein